MKNKLSNISNEFFLNTLAYWLAAVYVILIIALFYISNFYVRCNYQLHNDSLTKIATTPIVFFDKNPSGRVINRFSKDVINCDGMFHPNR